MDLEDCNQITDTTLHNLNIGCPALCSLSLSHCELLTDNGLSEFCGSHKDKIQILELDNCPHITDAAFEYMKPLKTLERVDLYDCQNITKEAIKKFKVTLIVNISKSFSSFSNFAPRQKFKLTLPPKLQKHLPSLLVKAFADVAIFCETSTIILTVILKLMRVIRNGLNCTYKYSIYNVKKFSIVFLKIL